MDGACGGFADGVRPCGLPFGDAAIWRLKLVAAATWDRRRRKEKPRSGGEKAHGVCRPGRDTAARRKKTAAEGGEKNIAAEHNDTAAGEKKHAGHAARQGELSARKVSKGFNWFV